MMPLVQSLHTAFVLNSVFCYIIQCKGRQMSVRALVTWQTVLQNIFSTFASQLLLLTHASYLA